MFHASKEVMASIEFYEDFVPKEEKETIQGLEA